MDLGNQENTFCVNNKEYKLSCNSRDEFAIDRYYNNHLKSQTHIINIRKRQLLNDTSSKVFFISNKLEQIIGILL